MDFEVCLYLVVLENILVGKQSTLFEVIAKVLCCVYIRLAFSTFTDLWLFAL